MPEMVAPRALVFRPLVKGNEDSGNEIAPFVIYVLRWVFKRVIYVVRKILSREMKDYNEFTHISNTVDIHSVCRDF